MNHRLQILPVANIHEPKLDLSSLESVKDQPAAPGTRKFFRSWLVYDSGLEPGRRNRHLNWNAILGVGFAVCFSVSFWVAAALLLWR